MRIRKGFTLIELLVVIAIIALLLAIVMPSLNMAKEHAQRMQCATNLRNIGQTLYIYAESQRGFIPEAFYGSPYGGGLQTSPAATYMIFDVNTSMTPPEIRKDTMVNFAILWTLKLIETSQTFYCPSSLRNPFSYDSYGGKERWPYPVYANSSNPERIRVSYSYLPQAIREKIDIGGRKFPARAVKWSQLEPGKAVSLDTLQAEEWWSHRRGSYAGANVLYGDTSVQFRRNPEVLSPTGGANPMEDPIDFRVLIQELE